MQEDSHDGTMLGGWRFRTAAALAIWLACSAALVWLVERDQIVVATLVWAVWFVTSMALVFLIASALIRFVRWRRQKQERARISRLLPPTDGPDQDMRTTDERR